MIKKLDYIVVHKNFKVAKKQVNNSYVFFIPFENTTIFVIL